MPTNAAVGTYVATVGLRDAGTIYDIAYQSDSFSVFQANPAASIVSAATGAPTYQPGQTVQLDALVENIGTVTLDSLWLNADIADSGGANVREGLWQNLPALSPGQSHQTGLGAAWTIPTDAQAGDYTITLGLRDNAAVYDIAYQIVTFSVAAAPNAAAHIVSAATDAPTYQPGQTVFLDALVENIGNMILDGLWLNADIADPGGANVREGLWQNLPALSPGQSHQTGLGAAWTIPTDAQAGDYSITLGLRDGQDIYDIKYGIVNFTVATAGTGAEIVSAVVDGSEYVEGDTVRLNVTVRNTSDTTLRSLQLDVVVTDPTGQQTVFNTWREKNRLRPGKEYRTRFQDLFQIPVGAVSGVYQVSVTLRDANQVYDVKTNVAQFTVTSDNPPPPPPPTSFPITSGKMLYHIYSNYDAYDGELYILDFATGVSTNVSAAWSNLSHTINGHFSPDGSQVVFMAVENSCGLIRSCWNVYLWDVGGGAPRNLTPNSNIVDEDPKFSPDGTKIVFKQNGDLKIYQLPNGPVTSVTADGDGGANEDSMPFFTADGNRIIYAKDARDNSDIWIINADGTNDQPLETIPAVQEYYPIVRDADTYLYTRWDSSNSGRHDQIYMGYVNSSNPPIKLLLNDDPSREYSDPYPVGRDYVLFSSNRNGSLSSYDLYLGHLTSGQIWDMNDFNINTGNEELGAAYTP